LPRISFDPPAAPPAAGPYSHVVRIGNIVSTAGQCGFRADGSLVDGLTGQVRQALANLKTALTTAGCTEDDVIGVNVFLAADDDFAAMNDVYREHFSEPYPARTTVTATLRPGVLFEVNALAVAAT
jgi:2-iminobutanoate/2-iminopropanoate deaminase